MASGHCCDQYSSQSHILRQGRGGLRVAREQDVQHLIVAPFGNIVDADVRPFGELNQQISVCTIESAVVVRSFMATEQRRVLSQQLCDCFLVATCRCEEKGLAGVGRLSKDQSKNCFSIFTCPNKTQQKEDLKNLCCCCK